MTTEDLALLVTGMIVVAGAFSCGVLVGTSLRKDVQHGDDDQGTTKESGWWHQPVHQGSQGGARCRGTGCPGKKPAARVAERAPIGRSDVWE